MTLASRSTGITVLVGLIILTPSVWALAPGDRVDNFRLFDHLGNSHELYYHTDANAIVLMVQGNGCPNVRRSMASFRSVRDAYTSKGVVFRLINSNAWDSRESIGEEARAFNYDVPILIDDTRLVGESLALTRTAEVLVIEPGTWVLKYRGAIEDRLQSEPQRPEPRRRHLVDALDAIIADEAVAVARTAVEGCPIDLAGGDAGPQLASYAETVAPILMDNCVPCHRPGGVGPWAMTHYDMVQGFSPMIREVIRTRRMPPWHADPYTGRFVNDRSLTTDEARTVVHWIEGGAPRGDGADPLAAAVDQAPDWHLGPPDLILELPAYDVPASGVVDYQDVTVTNPLNHDVWVRAAEFQPGDRQAVHHVITRFSEPSILGWIGYLWQQIRGEGGSFGDYVPGRAADEMPEGTGVLLPAGAVFTFQMHYTPYGRATTDRSRLGVYFHDEPPRDALISRELMNQRIRIPAHARSHSEQSSHVFEEDSLLYSLLPHAHYRGKAATFIAAYPNGTEEVLLSVPNYDFNWQMTYQFAEPLMIPEGTRVTFIMTWDNSAQNRANPDPDQEVRWGQQSWDEMLFALLTYRRLRAEEREQSLARSQQPQ